MFYDTRCRSIPLWCVDRRVLKIIDFSISAPCDFLGVLLERTAATYCTRNYRPPELWKPDVQLGDVCWAVDVWSVGCTVFEVATNRFLVNGTDSKEVAAHLQALLRVNPFTPTEMWHRVKLAASLSNIVRDAVHRTPCLRKLPK